MRVDILRNVFLGLTLVLNTGCGKEVNERLVSFEHPDLVKITKTFQYHENRRLREEYFRPNTFGQLYVPMGEASMKQNLPEDIDVVGVLSKEGGKFVLTLNMNFRARPNTSSLEWILVDKKSGKDVSKVSSMSSAKLVFRNVPRTDSVYRLELFMCKRNSSPGSVRESCGEASFRDITIAISKTR